VLAKLEGIMPRLMPLLAPIYIPRVPRDLLNDASVPHWMSTRPKWIGMSVEEFERRNPAQGAWDKAEGVIHEVTEMLKEDESGPFFLGKEVSYADFVWGGFLIFLRRIGEDVLEEGLRRSGGREVHEALLRGLEPWTRRCDY
jgi:glutathione S-transferase